MDHMMTSYRTSLLVSLALLAGCASGPALYDANPQARADAARYVTSDPAVQQQRFGAYAKAVGPYWLGTWFKGELVAMEYRWTIPGVVLEETQTQGTHKGRFKFQYNPETGRIDVFNVDVGGKHIREARLETDGSVFWPSAMLGIVDEYRVSVAQGKITYRYGDQSVSLRPGTAEEFAAHMAGSSQQLADKKREEREANDAMWNSIAAAGQAMASANAQAQAAQQSRQQPLAQQRQSPSGVGTGVTRPPSGGQGQASNATATPGLPTSAAGSASAQPVAGKPLRFVLTIGLRNKAGDAVNPTCYSNVISRAGPAGWGSRDSMAPEASRQARQTVQDLKARFIAQCRAQGREITSEGDFQWVWNEFQDGEQRVASTRARYREDVSVVMD